MELYFRATPWAIPLTALAAVAIALRSRRLAASVGMPSVFLTGFGTAVAGFFAVTITPSDGWQSALHSRRVSAEGTHFISPAEMLHRTEPSLNAWLCVPLGLFAVIAAVRYGRFLAAIVVLALPLASESIQWALPQLGRSAFLVADVVANWSGLAYGSVLGLACAVVIGVYAPRSTQPA